MAVAQRTVTHVSFVDGDVVERGFHSDAITTPTYFYTVYSVLFTEIFIHYTIVCKAQHIGIQVFNHN
jgi:hypothetical protein